MTTECNSKSGYCTDSLDSMTLSGDKNGVLRTHFVVVVLSFRRRYRREDGHRRRSKLRQKVFLLKGSSSLEEELDIDNRNVRKEKRIFSLISV